MVKRSETPSEQSPSDLLPSLVNLLPSQRRQLQGLPVVVLDQIEDLPVSSGTETSESESGFEELSFPRIIQHRIDEDLTSPRVVLHRIDENLVASEEILRKTNIRRTAVEDNNNHFELRDLNAANGIQPVNCATSDAESLLSVAELSDDSNLSCDLNDMGKKKEGEMVEKDVLITKKASVDAANESASKEDVGSVLEGVKLGRAEDVDAVLEGVKLGRAPADRVSLQSLIAEVENRISKALSELPEDDDIILDSDDSEEDSSSYEEDSLNETLEVSDGQEEVRKDEEVRTWEEKEVADKEAEPVGEDGRNENAAEGEKMEEEKEDGGDSERQRKIEEVLKKAQSIESEIHNTVNSEVDCSANEGRSKECLHASTMSASSAADLHLENASSRSDNPYQVFEKHGPKSAEKASAFASVTLEKYLEENSSLNCASFSSTSDDFEPDEDEVDGIVFRSFASREALRKHQALHRAEVTLGSGKHTRRTSGKSKDVTKYKGWKRRSRSIPKTTQSPPSVSIGDVSRKLCSADIESLGFSLKANPSKLKDSTRSVTSLRNKGPKRGLFRTAENERQPSKGLIYGRRYNGRFATRITVSRSQESRKPSSVTKEWQPMDSKRKQSPRRRPCDCQFEPAVITSSLAMTAISALQLSNMPACTKDGCRYGCICYLCESTDLYGDNGRTSFASQSSPIAPSESSLLESHGSGSMSSIDSTPAKISSCSNASSVHSAQIGGTERDHKSLQTSDASPQCDDGGEPAMPKVILRRTRYTVPSTKRTSKRVQNRPSYKEMMNPKSATFFESANVKTNKMGQKQKKGSKTRLKKAMEKYLSDPPSSGLRSENHGKLKGYLEKYLKSSQGQDATPAILQAPKKNAHKSPESDNHSDEDNANETSDVESNDSGTCARSIPFKPRNMPIAPVKKPVTSSRKVRLVLLKRKATPSFPDPDGLLLLEICSDCNWDPVANTLFSFLTTMLMKSLPVRSAVIQGLKVTVLRKRKRPLPLPDSINQRLGKRLAVPDVRIMLSDKFPKKQKVMDPVSQAPVLRHVLQNAFPCTSSDGFGSSSGMSSFSSLRINQVPKVNCSMLGSSVNLPSSTKDASRPVTPVETSKPPPVETPKPPPVNPSAQPVSVKIVADTERSKTSRNQTPKGHPVLVQIPSGLVMFTPSQQNDSTSPGKPGVAKDSSPSSIASRAETKISDEPKEKKTLAEPNDDEVDSSQPGDHQSIASVVIKEEDVKSETEVKEEEGEEVALLPTLTAAKPEEVEMKAEDENSSSSDLLKQGGSRVVIQFKEGSTHMTCMSSSGQQEMQLSDVKFQKIGDEHTPILTEDADVIEISSESEDEDVDVTLCSAVPNSAADHLREILGVSKPDDPPKMHKLLRKQMHEVRTEDEESMEFSEGLVLVPPSPKQKKHPKKHSKKHSKKHHGEKRTSSQKTAEEEPQEEEKDGNPEMEEEEDAAWDSTKIRKIVKVTKERRRRNDLSHRFWILQSTCFPDAPPNFRHPKLVIVCRAAEMIKELKTKWSALVQKKTDLIYQKQRLMKTLDSIEDGKVTVPRDTPALSHRELAIDESFLFHQQKALETPEGAEMIAGGGYTIPKYILGDGTTEALEAKLSQVQAAAGKKKDKKKKKKKKHGKDLSDFGKILKKKLKKAREKKLKSSSSVKGDGDVFSDLGGVECLDVIIPPKSGGKRALGMSNSPPHPVDLIQNLRNVPAKREGEEMGVSPPVSKKRKVEPCKSGSLGDELEIEIDQSTDISNVVKVIEYKSKSGETYKILVKKGEGDKEEEADENESSSEEETEVASEDAKSSDLKTGSDGETSKGPQVVNLENMMLVELDPAVSEHNYAQITNLCHSSQNGESPMDTMP